VEADEEGVGSGEEVGVDVDEAAVDDDACGWFFVGVVVGVSGEGEVLGLGAEAAGADEDDVCGGGCGGDGVAVGGEVAVESGAADEVLEAFGMDDVEVHRIGHVRGEE